MEALEHHASYVLKTDQSHSITMIMSHVFKKHCNMYLAVLISIYLSLN